MATELLILFGMTLFGFFFFLLGLREDNSQQAFVWNFLAFVLLLSTALLLQKDGVKTLAYTTYNSSTGTITDVYTSVTSETNLSYMVWQMICTGFAFIGFASAIKNAVRIGSN